MASWLIILLIVLACTLLGMVVVLQFVTRRSRPGLELLFAALTLGIIVSGWLALLLAEIGLFSRSALLLSWLGMALLLLLLGWRKIRGFRKQKDDLQLADQEEQAATGDRAERVEIILLIVWVAAAGWLFFRPHEYIMGAADAGVYVSLGAEIAQRGGFQIVDEELARLDPSLYAVTLRPLPSNPVASSYLVPGFYVSNAEEGVITPQFYPLHPVWQAVAFSFSNSVVGGVRAELLMSGLWMLLASVVIFLTLREVAGRITAVLVLMALSITALQVWFARYPTTEALTQYLLWAGLWGMAMWFGNRQPPSLWAFVSGMALGSVFLVRIDMIILLPIFLLLIVILFARGWRTSDAWFAAPFTLLVVHSFAHGILLSAPYFYVHIGFGFRLLWQNWPILLAAVSAGVISLGTILLFRGRFTILRRYKRAVLLGLIGAVLLFAIYGWFIRPAVASATLIPDSYSKTELLLSDHENWLRLGWYLFPIGIWLGVLGSCLLLWRVEWKTAVLLAVGLLSSTVYLWKVGANPHHVYVMRRYVPVVAPFFLFAAAFLIGWLVEQGRVRQQTSSWQKVGLLGLSLLLAFSWLIGLGWSARGFISQVDHKGIVEQVAAINDELTPGSVLIFNDQSVVGLGDFWGTPLRFIFGHDVFTLRDLDALEEKRLAETIKFWQNNGREVVWVGDPAWLADNDFRYRERTYTISSQKLEGSYEYKPQRVISINWTLPMAFIESGRSDSG